MNRQELYYQVAHSQKAEQEQRNRQLEIKATWTLGFASTLVGVAVIVLKDFSGSGDLSFDTPTLLVLVGFVLAFLSIVVSALNVIRIRTWRHDPILADFAKVLYDYEEDGLTEWAGDQFKNAVEANEGLLTAKAKSVTWSLGSLAALVLFLGALSITIRF